MKQFTNFGLPSGARRSNLWLSNGLARKRVVARSEFSTPMPGTEAPAFSVVPRWFPSGAVCDGSSQPFYGRRSDAWRVGSESIVLGAQACLFISGSLFHTR